MSDAQHPVEYLAELALGVLPETQASAIRVHVAGCDACRMEFEEMARVAALLPFASEEVKPSPALKQSVLERVTREPIAISSVPASRSVPRRMGIAAIAAVFAMVMATAALAFFAGRATTHDDDTSTEAAFVEAAARGTLETAAAEADGARAVVVRVPGHTQAFAWVEGLPALPSGKAFQAWFIDGAGAEPAQVFDIHQGGVWLQATAPVEHYRAIGLTIEDEGGAEQPSSQPFVVVELSRQAAKP